MKISRIGPELAPLTQVHAIRSALPRELAISDLPSRVGAALAGSDPATALRMLVEEIRSELQARLGSAVTLPSTRPGPLDADAAVATVLRLLQAAGRALPGGLESQPSLNLLKLAVDAGIERVGVILSKASPPATTLTATLDRVAARLRGALEVMSPPPPAAGPRLVLSQAIVREISLALTERIGMLPRPVLPASSPRDPAEALVQLSSLFRAVAADSVLAIRASPRVIEAAVRDGMQRALGQLPAAARADREVTRLAADLRTLALRAGGAGADSALRLPMPADAPAAMRLFVAEFRAALGEQLPQASAGRAATAPPPDLTRALGALASVTAETLARLKHSDPQALRLVLLAAADTAAGRTQLQLPGGVVAESPMRAAIETLRTSFLGLLAAAEAAGSGRGLDARAWVSLLARAGESLQQGGVPPFRFDLPVPRPGSPRRRGLPPGLGDSVDAIDSSDPGEPGDLSERAEEGPLGPSIWPRMPEM